MSKVYLAQGEKNALKLFHLAAKRVPAYKDFLKKNRVRAEKIKTIRDFKSLPVIEKKNYLQKYSLPQLCIDGEMPPMAYASSGSSGKQTFWFRGDEQEVAVGEIHETIFGKAFGIKKDEPTLAIICFSMGVWVAGNYTLAACRYVARRGYNLVSITPGTEREDILSIFRNLAPKFKNVILAGYPPFLMDIVGDALNLGIRFKNNVKIITAGDKFSEEWRKAIAQLVGIKDPARSIVSIYGSADAGVLGHETPLSAFVRQQSMHNSALYAELFGEERDAPAFVQYDPSHIFFEQVGSELVFTVKTAVPLVRYNIHDIGTVIEYEKLVKILRKYHLEKKAKRYGLSEWAFPSLVKKGRTDVAVTFYALNIYPENIRAGLEDRRVAKLVSGQFFAFNKTVNKNKNQKLYLNIELAPGVKPGSKILRSITKSIFENLTRLNSEYRRLYAIIKQKAFPKIKLVSFGEQKFFTKSNRGLLTMNGKKPRILQPQ